MNEYEDDEMEKLYDRIEEILEKNGKSGTKLSDVKTQTIFFFLKKKVNYGTTIIGLTLFLNLGLIVWHSAPKLLTQGTTIIGITLFLNLGLIVWHSAAKLLTQGVDGFYFLLTRGLSPV